MPTHYLAIDLGAESGRVMLGTLDGGRFSLEELHRFPNIPASNGNSLTWNLPQLFEETKAGLRKAAARQLPIASLSTDSWGVDYALFDDTGALMSPTFHYRDTRTARGVKAVKKRVDWKTIFDETGIQFMPLNTIFQLAAETPERLARAAQMLTIADAFNFLLCGTARIDESSASTTQLYNPRTKTWSEKLLHALGLPERMFPPIVPCGTRLGPLKSNISRDTGLPALEVIASCSHDTAAAVAAVPSDSSQTQDTRPHPPTWAYLSSGTWSLLGAELPFPVITDACRELNFTNEIGHGGSVRLLKNIIGLWLVQECRREWERAGQHFDYATLTQLATDAPPFVSLINPADPRFLAPGEMPQRIAAFCRENGQPEPQSPGATIRCVLESLALLYRRTLRQLEPLFGNKFERLHIVGGGSQNALLNQFTADALQLPVLAGPVEATALGNIAVQALVLGHLPSLAAAREVIRASFDLTTFPPQAGAGWEEQAARFEKRAWRA
jgi:rhamnulokinase